MYVQDAFLNHKFLGSREIYLKENSDRTKQARATLLVAISNGVIPVKVKSMEES